VKLVFHGFNVRKELLRHFYKTYSGAGASAIISDRCLVLLKSSRNPYSLHLDLIDLVSPLKPPVRLEIPIRLEPADAAVVSEPPPINAARLAGFTPSPYVRDEDAERIIVLLLPFIFEFVTIVISVQHLLQRFQDGSSCAWGEWGPDATRWIRDLGAYGSHSCVSGAVFGTQTRKELRVDEEGYYKGPLRPPPDEGPSRTIAIFDFNPRPIHKLGDSDGEFISEEDDRMIGKPVVDEWIWEAALFTEPVSQGYHSGYLPVGGQPYTMR
jgi:hypothetical protein